MMRARRRQEAGFTLVEVLVSISILAIITGALAASFEVGFQSVGVGGSQARAAGAHDLSAFEQELSIDVTRASCISLGTAATTYGACSQSIIPSGVEAATCSAAVLCVGWSQSSGNNVGCEVDAYTEPSGGGKVVRSVYLTPNWTTPIQSVNVTTTYGVIKLAPSVTQFSAVSGTWVKQLAVTVTAKGVSASSNPPTGTLTVVPLTTDPGGQAETVLC